MMKWLYFQFFINLIVLAELFKFSYCFHNSNKKSKISARKLFKIDEQLKEIDNHYGTNFAVDNTNSFGLLERTDLGPAVDLSVVSFFKPRFKLNLNNMSAFENFLAKIFIGVFTSFELFDAKFSKHIFIFYHCFNLF